MQTPGEQRWRGVVVVAVLALCAYAFWLRTLYTFGGLMLGGEYVHNLDPDIHMHLRRLAQLDATGVLPRSDAFVNFPDDFRAGWPVALEPLTLALRALSFDSDREGMLLAAGVLPALVGALAVAVTTFALLGRVSAGAAVAGGLAVAVAPAALSATGFGLYDHHCLELLVALALPLLVPGGALAGAVASFVCLLSADGTYVVVGAAAAVALARLFRLHPWPPAGGRRFAAFLLGGLAGAAAASALELSLDLPRALPHSGRLGLFALAAGLAVFAESSGRGRWASGLLASAGLALCLPMVLTAGGYLTASTDPISPFIQQSRPLWSTNPAGLAVVLPAGLLTGLLAWRRRDRPADALPFAVAVLGGLLAVVQVKYAFLGVPALAIAAAGAVEAVLRRSGGARVGAFAVGALGLWVLGVRTWTELHEAPAGVAAADAEFAVVAQAFQARSPRLDAQAPTDGVLAHPDDGPRLLRLSGRPVTAVPFWADETQRAHYLDALRALMSRDERAAVAVMERFRLRYVWVSDLRDRAEVTVRILGDSAYEAGTDERSLAYMQGLWSRLFTVDGAEATETDGAHRLEALHHFRWVAGSPRYRVFERVAGARLSGRAAPGDRVVVDMAVATPERPLRYRASAVAAPDGRFALILPYATEAAAPGGHAVAARLSCTAGDRPLTVSEAAVTGGLDISLDCPGP